MSIFTYLTPAAIGPVWPAMLLCFAYMLTTTGFIVLAKVRAWFRSFSLREHRFLQRLYDATEMVSTFAILCGMLGTCVGLLEVLPVLGASLRDSGNTDLLQQVLTPLRNVWASTVAGLILGGLWGEVLIFMLKPYTRPVLLPLSSEEPPDEAFDLAPPTRAFEPENPPPSTTNQDFADDWRQKDPEGMY
jgi:hypothetical protein